MFEEISEIDDAHFFKCSYLSSSVRESEKTLDFWSIPQYCSTLNEGVDNITSPLYSLYIFQLISICASNFIPLAVWLLVNKTISSTLNF